MSTNVEPYENAASEASRASEQLGAGARFPVRVQRREWIAEGIVRLDLLPESGEPACEFAPGAHVDLHLPNSLVRSYSLLDDPARTRCYQVAVADVQNSRGGSSFICYHLAAGDRLTISAPRNNFPLVRDARSLAFIAGGIGITPILSMVRHLGPSAGNWKLLYCTRSRSRAAFLDELNGMAIDASLHTHFDDEVVEVFADIDAFVGSAPADTHFYCCGPKPMLDAFGRATSRISPDRVHIERFNSDEPPSLEGGFQVELQQSGLTVFVEPGKSVLNALLDAGVDVPFSCMEGTCGTCETRVLSGTPDHRDGFLTEDERATNQTMMICCSGSKSSLLTLDL